MPENGSQKELERLEAEMAMALSDPSLPQEKRAHLQQRLEAIRAKSRPPAPPE